MLPRQVLRSADSPAVRGRRACSRRKMGPMATPRAVASPFRVTFFSARGPSVGSSCSALRTGGSAKRDLRDQPGALLVARRPSARAAAR